MKRMVWLLAGMCFLAVSVSAVLVVVWPMVLAGLPFGPVLVSVLDGRVFAVLLVLVLLPSTGIFVHRYRSEDADAQRSSGLFVDVLIPVYQDANVVHRPVEALHASPYEDLRVTIIVPEEDAETIERARELSEAYEEVRVLVNDRYSRAKPGNLNYGVEESDADAFAIFDADQRPDTRFIPHAVAALENHDVVRGRAVPRPSGLVESLSYYESIVFFVIPKNLLTAVTGFRFAETRNVVFRSGVVERVGMFDEAALADDLDFSQRVHAAGIPVREVVHFPCMEEAAHTWMDWWRQRKRWMKGYMQVAHRRGHDAASEGSAHHAVHAGMTLAIVFVAMLASVALPKLAVLASMYPVFAGAALVSLYGPALLVRRLDAWEEGFHMDWVWLLLPAAISFFGLATVLAAFDYVVRGRGEWYQAEKQAG